METASSCRGRRLHLPWGWRSAGSRLVGAWAGCGRLPARRRLACPAETAYYAVARWMAYSKSALLATPSSTTLGAEAWDAYHGGGRPAPCPGRGPAIVGDDAWLAFEGGGSQEGEGGVVVAAAGASSFASLGAQATDGGVLDFEAAVAFEAACDLASEGRSAWASWAAAACTSAERACDADFPFQACRTSPLAPFLVQPFDAGRTLPATAR